MTATPCPALRVAARGSAGVAGVGARSLAADSEFLTALRDVRDAARALREACGTGSG